MTGYEQYLEDWKVAGKSSKKKKYNDEGQRVELQEDDQKRAMGINVRFSLRYNFINDLEEDIH